jgi:hypothetical protein
MLLCSAASFAGNRLFSFFMQICSKVESKVEYYRLYILLLWVLRDERAVTDLGNAYVLSMVAFRESFIEKEHISGRPEE